MFDAMNILAANNLALLTVEGFVNPKLKIEKVTTNRMGKVKHERGISSGFYLGDRLASKMLHIFRL